MAQDNKVNMPAGFGGLTRYDEEYDSFINLKPSHVILFIVAVVVFRVGLSVFLK